jgi:hypothetical protein
MTAEQQHALKHPLLLWSRLEFVLEGFVDVLLFHTCLFCLIGAKSTTISTFVALAGHSAFTLMAEAWGLQPDSMLAGYWSECCFW